MERWKEVIGNEEAEGKERERRGEMMEGQIQR